MVAGAGLLVGPWRFLVAGQVVMIERGPLRSVEGILQEVKKALRLIVSVHLLRRSVSAEISRNWIRPVALSTGFHPCKRLRASRR